MMKKLTLIVTALALMLGICGCGSDGAGISVQRADQLAAAGQAGDRYAGMVVSENVVEIQRDSSKTVEELYVEVGQEVKAGDKLFSYDSDALELDLEKAQLEVEKMENEQADYTEQLAKLEKQILRHRTKLEKRLREDIPVSVPEFIEEAPSQEDRKVVRTKTYTTRPMHVEDAILQMELLGHAFFVFVNIDTDQTNVLYLRKDGNLGLLEPEY